MWDVKEPKHYSKRVGREVPGVVAVLCVVDTGPMLIAVTTITEMVILYKYVEIINQSIINQQTLLDSLTEISWILYARPEERCPRSILRLHHQSFLHGIACEEVIGKPQILSEKKFYGRYLHSLVHAPIQHRIICCRSTNTEQRERHFITLSSISTSASSSRPGEIITTGIKRMQS